MIKMPPAVSMKPVSSKYLRPILPNPNSSGFLALRQDADISYHDVARAREHKDDGLGNVLRWQPAFALNEPFEIFGSNL
ncbi:MULTISPECIES: hypothetical protein [unclassified Rhizobium]|uniref:hypothetical protein n=1 Tax=unclassified Rhizobium TaxID=2613769 RepID=UPI001ADC0EC5|nr:MULTISPECIES: hypothetical protein [unclassified Rhizobium]MBO9096859.1 hypothetical protein [Rhizobium sp. L58/93]MBO9167102.1 hypothetical protein [Rhizobium sp. L245/93]QXZ88227.1 hypothetical protein J5287_31490 [Rhizobium sp. K1/93]QXZ94198.1 hypothetical protein J5280_31025 [Rhizobium sp. K15/93]QYA05704.1 hypothetical protein J5278_29610 [Rhizobium sp. B21/90]